MASNGKGRPKWSGLFYFFSMLWVSPVSAQTQFALGFGGFTPNPKVSLNFKHDNYPAGSTQSAHVSISGPKNGTYTVNITDKAKNQVASIDLKIGGAPKSNQGKVNIALPSQPKEETYTATLTISGKKVTDDDSVKAVNVSLTTDKVTQSLTETAQLKAVLAPSNASATNYRFEIKRISSSQWYTLSVGGSNSFSWVRRVAGQFHLRATAALDGGVVRSSNVYGATQFPDYATIVGDGTVSGAADAAWTSTKNAANASDSREEGFWIRLNTGGSGTYQSTVTIYGATLPPAQQQSVVLGARPDDSPLQPAPNATSVTYTVASFHTHPPMTHVGNTLERDVGPSGGDVSADNTQQVVGVVYDYIASPSGGATIPGGHPLNSVAQLYHSGPNRRPTP